MMTSAAAATTRVLRCRRRALWGRHEVRLGLVVLRRDATRAFEEQPCRRPPAGPRRRRRPIGRPADLRVRCFDPDPADGVPEVGAGREGADVGAGAGQDEPVDGLVRGEPPAAMLDAYDAWTRRCPNRIAATSSQRQRLRPRAPAAASGAAVERPRGTTQPATSPTSRPDARARPASSGAAGPRAGRLRRLGRLGIGAHRSTHRAGLRPRVTAPGARCRHACFSPLRSLFSSRSATVPASGITASGSTSYQGWRTNARSAARGWGRRRLSS